MSSVPATLRECHRLRTHLRDLQAEIDRGPRVMQTWRDDLETARQEHAAHYEAITKAKLKQREDEGSLKQTDVRLAKLEEQLAGIGVAKEYAAKEHEIAHAKTKKGELEEAIFASMTEVEERTAAIPAVEAKWAEAQAEFAQFEVDAAERLERMKADMEASAADLARADATLPPEVMPTYQTIVRAKGPDGFAAAKARVCQGCRTSMTETEFTELKKGTFRTCTTCGRMQYPVA